MNEISETELVELLESDEEFTLLDVRANDYYLWEHLPKASQLRWKYIAEEAPKRFPDKDQLIITYCQGITCGVSAKGYKELEKLGYTNLMEFSGGIEGWRAAGLEILSDPMYRVNEQTYRFPKQEFHGEQVGSYLIVTKTKLVLVDPPQQLTEEHLDFIDSFHLPIICVLTHDSSGGCADELRRRNGAEIWLHQNDKDGKSLTVKPTKLIGGDTKILDAIEIVCTPGHTAGSVCVFDQRNGALFSGDHLTGNEKGGFRGFDASDLTKSNPTDWIASLKRLQQLAIKEVHPFHHYPVLNQVSTNLQALISQQESKESV